ncbi:LVIVD repeat-containing protein [Bdellovibrio bacteriovorus]|uniref:LVIVD repeat protein n=1 Tax=Bdellovibrio bacteriovorus TaxID=959 RepID=A0A1Z3N6Z5_BDEBC|nr:hypothetical protein [Bdellovibrio bacteriovorus]ASD63235.1 hypothetical protein B9G79_06465 [Bdellovibrio bacteriovorus]
MRTFWKIIINCLLLLTTSCGLVNAELFRRVQQADIGSEDPGPTPPAPIISDKIDRWGYGRTQYDVLISGSYIISGGRKGLTILDATDPYTPVEVNSFKTYTVSKLTKVDDLAFVSYNNGILEVFDISNPAGPVARSSVTLTAPKRVAVKNSLAYVPDGASGLRVIDFSDPGNITLVTTIDTTGVALSASIDGNYLYLADQWDGVKIFDISTPSTPTQIGSYNVGGDAMDVKVKGSHAFVTVDWDNITILDITNKTAPALVTNFYDQYNYYNAFTQIEIKNNYLFAMDFYDGITVYDISTPATPVFKGVATPYTTRWWGEPYGFASNDTHIFMAVETYGITAVDVSNPAQPHVPYAYRPQRSWVNSVSVVGTIAAVCENDWGRLLMVDISNPAKPTLLSTTESGCSRELIYDGTYVYAAMNNSGLKILNVSNPASPADIGNIDNGSSARQIAKSGNFVYLAYSGALYIYNVSNPAAPAVAGTYAYTANDIIVEGNYAYLAGATTLRIIDISNPASITVVGSYTYPSGTATSYSLIKSGSLIYVGGSESLGVLDISNPAAPTLISKDTKTDTPESMTILGNKLYSCNYDVGVHEWDLATPTSPVRIDSFLLGGCLGITSLSGTVYIADEETGLRILNSSSRKYLRMENPLSLMSVNSITVGASHIYLPDSFMGIVTLNNSNPLRPEFTSRINSMSVVAAPIEENNILYVADQYFIRTIDITDAANPVSLGSSARFSATGGYINALAKKGSLLYTIEGSFLGIYNVADPANILQVASPSYASMMELTVSGNMLLAASGSTGLRVFDISTPTSPSLSGTYNSPGSARHAILDGTYAYLADGTAGLQVVDVSNPASPTAVATYDTAGTAISLAKKGNYVFVADSGHVEVIDVTDPLNPTLKTTMNKTLFGGANSKAVVIKGNYLYVLLYDGIEVFDISDIDNIHQ